MKIAILTYHRTLNYGAVLQSYALQKKIINLGYETDILDYKCSAIEERYRTKKLNELKSIKEFIKYFLTKRNMNKLKCKFDKFNNNYQIFSKKSYDNNNIADSNKHYDKFITGSDQVWNFKLSGEDTTYFLSFVEDNKKKKSYASSFGYEIIPEEYKEKTKKMLSNYNMLSTREKQGQEIIKDLLNLEVPVVLDPTFLLNRQDWDNICKDQIIKEDYILVYTIASTPTIFEFTRKLAKQKKCKILYINHSYKVMFGAKNIKDASVEEFLTYLKYAKYVVTTSFHGVALSINLNKEFFYELSTKEGNFNSRIESIVELFELKNRQIFAEESKSINLDIDYNKVNYRLEEERQKSLKYLKMCLEE